MVNMIIEYHRPKDLTEALALLARIEIRTVPLGGGTSLNSPAFLSAQFPTIDIAVVDLQDLGLNTIEHNGAFIEIGATVTLQALLDFPSLQEALHRAIQLETTFNLRQMATVSGRLVAADGRSPFGTVMLALDTRLTILPGDETRNLGDLFPLRAEQLSKRLIAKVYLPVVAKLAFEYVARTPADLPIVCAAMARWPSGRTRLAVGGYGKAPELVMDGPEPDGAEIAARTTYSQAGDEWASAAYRNDVAGVLTRRCLDALSDTSEV
jgi:CO/xanthine dehydrogenase FAD-binding subunit